MRSTYPGWYTRSPEELAEIWRRAIFVPDTNVLLHCLRHTAPVRTELLRVLTALKDTLWIPYQIGLEFHRNRLQVEATTEEAYTRLCEHYQSAFNQTSERLRKLRTHPVISIENELKTLEKFIEGFRARMMEARERHPREGIAAATAQLTELLEGRTGDSWPDYRVDILKKEGEQRFAREVPPGYKDVKKDANELDKYGDLMIWMDMMDQANAMQRPVVLISDDFKEDWWWIDRGRKLGARPELIEEFRAHSGQEFHIYEFRQFLRIAARYYPGVKTRVEEDTSSLRENEKTRQRASDSTAETTELGARIRKLEAERERIILSLSGHAEDLKGPSDKESLRRRLVALTLEAAVLRFTPIV